MSQIAGFPDGWEVEDEVDGGIAIRIRMFPALVGWLIMLASVPAIVVVAVVLPSGTPDEAQAKMVALAATICAESIAAYVGLVFALNRYRIVAGREGILVSAGPLWWPVSKAVARDDIAGIEAFTYHYKGSTYRRVLAVTKSGAKVIVVDRLPSLEVAEALAAEVRRRVGLAG